MAVKAALRHLLGHVPLGLWQTLFPKDVYTVFYHVVADVDLPHVQHYAYKDSARFAADIGWLAEHFPFQPYAELAAARLRGAVAPRGAALVTFDDGFAECFDVARPILLRHRASAIFFVTTDFIDDREVYYESRIALAIDAVGQLDADAAEDAWQQLEKTASDLPGFALRDAREPGTGRLGRGRILTPPTPRHRQLIIWLLNLAQEHEELAKAFCEVLGVDMAAYRAERRLFMSPGELRQLHAEGFTVGAHGTRHRKLQTMSPEELETEIVASCDAVRQITGQRVVPFAFPHSGRGLDRARLEEIRRRHPFVDLYFDTGGLRREASWIVHRVGADSPAGAPEGGTNLPILLRRAHSARTAWSRAR